MGRHRSATVREFGFRGKAVQIRQLPTGSTGVRCSRCTTHLLDQLGGELWESVRGAHVLELGSGCGTVAIALAKAGVEKIYATDCEKGALKNLRWNVESEAVQGAVHVAEWDWTHPPPRSIPLQNITLVVGADLVWDAWDTSKSLCAAVLEIKQVAPTAPILLALEERHAHRCEAFVQQLTLLGLSVQVDVIDTPLEAAGHDTTQSVHSPTGPGLAVAVDPEESSPQSDELAALEARDAVALSAADAAVAATKVEPASDKAGFEPPVSSDAGAIGFEPGNSGDGIEDEVLDPFEVEVSDDDDLERAHMYPSGTVLLLRL
eukprot:m.476332 g.476332  ORF g.476332 m.476332 type:complete len:319 (+) comp40649_c0_seq1:155-1111(+)